MGYVCSRSAPSEHSGVALLGAERGEGGGATKIADKSLKTFIPEKEIKENAKD
jgi:hypothetical protein